MERDRKGRIIAVTSMLIAVVFLTIAYAVFSKSLNIQNISATVKANETNFSVKFSRHSSILDESDVIPYFNSAATGTASNAHIDNSGLNPKLTNLSLQIAKAQLADLELNYELYVINDGAYDAYLKSIKIANVPGYDKPLVCIASEGTSQKLVDEACKLIGIIISAAGKSIRVKSVGVSHGDSNTSYATPGNYTGITEKKLLKNFGNSHYVHIYYSCMANLALIDGSFEIKVGDLSFEYSTQD